jgi:hypothetical protein
METYFLNYFYKFFIKVLFILLFYMNYLFYSSRCESSTNFIRILTNKGLVNMFHMISVDQMPVEQIVNLGINFTPMVVIKGQNNQSSSFEGKKAFEWLDSVVKFREENMARMVEMNRRKILQANAQTNQNNQILSFQPLETNGISDNFSYTAENLQDVAQPKSFMPYGQDTDFKIVTFRDNQGKMSTSELNDKLKQYTDKHSQQTEAIQNLVENQMKTALINKLQTT